MSGKRRRKRSWSAPRSKRVHQTPEPPIGAITSDVAEHILKFCDLISLHALSRLAFFRTRWGDARLLQFTRPADGGEWLFLPFTSLIKIRPPQGSPHSDGRQIYLSLAQPKRYFVRTPRDFFGRVMSSPKRLPHSWDIVRILHNLIGRVLCGEYSSQTDDQWNLFERLLIGNRMVVSAFKNNFGDFVFPTGSLGRASLASLGLHLCITVSRTYLIKWTRALLTEGMTTPDNGRPSAKFEELKIPTVVRTIVDTFCSTQKTVEMIPSATLELEGVVLSERAGRAVAPYGLSARLSVPRQQLEWDDTAHRFLDDNHETGSWRWHHLSFINDMMQVTLIDNTPSVVRYGDVDSKHRLVYSYGNLFSNQDPLMPLARVSREELIKLLKR